MKHSLFGLFFVVLVSLSTTPAAGYQRKLTTMTSPGWSKQACPPM